MIRLRVIIPARNEAKAIGNAIDSIHEACCECNAAAEVVVVDHGSTDATSEIAQANGATVIDGSKLRTVAALRNAGAKGASGILAFVDADVTVTPAWADAIVRNANDLLRTPGLVTGNDVVCAPPRSRCMCGWFCVPGRNRSYINSANVIVGATTFQEIGGFNADMETGEDHDFCRSARTHGAIVKKDPALVAYHHGVPQTLSEFFRQQLWHGAGSIRAGGRLLDSKTNVLVVVLAVAYLTLPAMAFVAHVWWLALGPLVLHVTAAAAASLARVRRHFSDIPGLFLMYLVYFSARIVSLTAWLIPSVGRHWKSQ